MYISKEYIQGNYSFVETSLGDLEDLIISRGLTVEDYVVVEFGFLYYATHKECFTSDYFNEYIKEEELCN